MHREIRRELKAGLRDGEEEVWELEARAESLLEEASKLKIELAKDERHDASRAKAMRS